MRFEKGTPGENGCIIDTDVDGQGQEASIAPGEQVTITFDFTVWRLPTSFPYHQIVAGIDDEPVFGCLYHGIPPTYPGITLSKTFDFISTGSGVFEVSVYRGLQYTCQASLDRYPAGRVVTATIEVPPTAPEMNVAMIIGPALVGMVALTQINGKVI